MTAETRTTYPGTASDGDVLTAANFNKLPGGWMAYDGFDTSPHALDSDGTTLLDMTLTMDAGRLLRITASAVVSNATGSITLKVFDGGTLLLETSAGNQVWSFSVFLTPSAGEHEISFVGVDSAADALVSTAYLLVEDIGPAPS